MATTELLITNVRVVRPDAPEGTEPQLTDIAVNDGVIARIAPNLDRADAAKVVDGRGLLAFPGVVDAHQHWASTTSCPPTRAPRAAPRRRAVSRPR